MYGLMDVVVILVILVIVFGAKWLPATGAAIGRALAARAARSRERSASRAEPGRSDPPPPQSRAVPDKGGSAD